MKIDELEEFAESCKVSIFAYSKTRNVFAYNEDTIIDAACTLKVFIMLDYVRQIYEKTINGDEFLTVTDENNATGAGTVKFLSCGMNIKADDLVELMVAISDHMAANILIDFLGINHINDTMNMFGFSNTILKKKYLVPKSRHVGFITAHDYAKFYYMLDNNEFFNEEACDYMKQILKTQKYKDFLAEPLFDEPDYIDMACKSGKVDGRTIEPMSNSVVNDGGIIITRKGNYYMAFISEILNNQAVSMADLKRLMHIVSRNIFREVLVNETNICKAW